MNDFEQNSSPLKVLRAVLESIPVRVFWKDREGRYLGCNTLFARDAGFGDPREMLGRTDFEMGWTSQAELYRRDDFAVMASDTPRLGFEEPQTTPDGRTIWLRTSKVPLHDASGAVAGLLGIYEDITERQAAERELQASERRFRDLFENSPDGCWIIDADNRFVLCNRAAALMLGFAGARELLAVHPSALSPPTQPCGRDSLALAEEMIATARRDGVHRFEWVHRRRDGSCFPVEVTLSRLSADERSPLYCTWRDITERRRAEADLRESRRMHDEAQRIAGLGHWREELADGLLHWSDQTFRILGMEPRDAPVPYSELARRVHPDDRRRQEQAFEATLRDGTAYEVEYRVQPAPGVERWVVERGVVERDAAGAVVRIVGTLMDITDRRQAEERLRASEERFQLAMAGANDGLWDWDLRTDEVYYSPRWLSMLGYGPRELPSTLDTWSRLVHDDDRERVLARVDDYLAGRVDSFDVEMRMRHADGHDVIVLSRATKVVEAGEPVRIVGTHVDITARKAAERQVLENERSYRGILDGLNEAVYVMDAEGRILDVNAGALRMDGRSREELVGSPMTVLSAPERGDPERLLAMTRAAFDGAAQSFESWSARAGGHVFPKEVHLYPGEHLGRRVVIAVATDISERKRFEEQLLQSQKMEAIGRLVGGIAHDFNNMLAAIQGNAFLAARRLAADDPVRQKLDNIDQLTSRAADMVQQLLTFARRGSVQMRSFTLNDCLREGYALAEAVIPASIDHRADICDEALVIEGDATQIQQAMMNLLNNAVDAVAGSSRPLIRVTLAPFTAGDEFQRRHPLMQARRYACITVSDNGHGMPADRIDKIFEPFFTTKPVGQGTGLGLAMLYGAVQNHGGTVEVESEEGRGSTFRLFLPLGGEEGSLLPRAARGGSMGGGETVLLVDDDDDVRAMTSEVLACMGYAVVEARDGREALEQFVRERDRIRLVMSDVVMPRMGGRALLEAIRAQDRDLPVILVTGYDRGQVLDGDLPARRCQVLNKPFEFAALSRTIRELLDAA